MIQDTIIIESIPVKRKDLINNKTYIGWLVHAKDLGWFFSTDNKWATEQEVITKTNR